MSLVVVDLGIGHGLRECDAERAMRPVVHRERVVGRHGPEILVLRNPHGLGHDVRPSTATPDWAIALGAIEIVHDTVR